jgi:hypothetical protein
MKFFRLWHPEYTTDRENKRANPLEPGLNLCMPGIICTACHETVGGYRDTFIEVPEGFKDRRLETGWPISDAEWFSLANYVRDVLHIAEAFELRPGDNIGIPEYLVTKPVISDIMFYIGPKLATKRVVESIHAGGVTGLDAVRVRTRWHARARDKSQPIPELYGLNVTGRAWRRDVDKESVTLCENCGRRSFPAPDEIIIDESKWDGSDIFLIDDVWTYVMVTERVRELFEHAEFSNCRFIPTP